MKRAVRILGTLSLLVLLAWRVDLRSVKDSLDGVRWQWWLAGLTAYFIAQLVSSVRWQRLSAPLGFQQSLPIYLGYVLVGNFFNLLLPSSVGGDVARAWYLGRGTGLAPRAVLSVLADRLNGLYVLVVMACVAATLVTLPPWAVGFIVLSGVGGAVGLGLVVVLHSSGQPLSDGSRWRRRWQELAGALELYRRAPGMLAVVTVLSLLVQLLNVVLVWCLAGAVGVPVSFTYCCVLMPIVTLLTLAPISVNGMGVREGAMVVLLAPLGIPAGQAITLSLLWFSVFLAAGLTGGVWFVTGRLPRCEVATNAEPVRGHPDQGRTGQPATAA